jgi:hypothetical protein
MNATEDRLVVLFMCFKLFTFSGSWTGLQKHLLCLYLLTWISCTTWNGAAYKSILLSYEQKKAIQSSPGTERLAMI